jgi:hypothetical protein
MPVRRAHRSGGHDHAAHSHYVERTVGRPTALTDEVADEILAALRHGVPFTHSCRAAGVSPDTGYRWLRIGRGVGAEHEDWELAPKTRERYRAFAIAVDQAESEAIVTNVGHVGRAAEDDWRAAAFMLQARAPEHFGREVTVKVKGIPELEQELRELVGNETAEVMMADAKRRIHQALARSETPALPTATEDE